MCETSPCVQRIVFILKMHLFIFERKRERVHAHKREGQREKERETSADFLLREGALS